MTIYSRQWDVNSFTDPRVKPYKVSECKDGTWQCSCPAWTMHTPRKDCKHINAIRSGLGKMPTAPVFAAKPARKDETPETVFGGFTIRRRRDDVDEMDGSDAVEVRRKARSL